MHLIGSHACISTKRVALLLTLFIIYLIGSFSSGTPNLPIYMEWAEKIASGHLFELYHVKNGASLSASLGDLIVPYPPLTLFAFFIVAKIVSILFSVDGISYGFIVNLSAVIATFATGVFLINSGTLFKSRTYLVFLTCPIVFLMSPILGYQDSLMAFFLLAGIYYLMRNRFLTSGIFLAFALTTKQLALMPIVGVGIVLLLQRNWRAVTRVTCTGGATISLILLPFILTGNLLAYLKSQALASVHTMLAAQTANVPYLITLLYRILNRGFSEAFNLGGNGLRIMDDQFRQLAYFGFALCALAVFTLWIGYFHRRFGLLQANLFQVSTMMIMSYYLFCAGVHENHIYMALPLILCLPSSVAARKVFISFSCGLFIHLIISWGVGNSFPAFTEILALSGDANTFGTLISFVLYLYAFLNLWKLSPLVGNQHQSTNNLNSRQGEQ